VPEHPASIAAAVKRLVSDEELRRRIVTNARHLAATIYAWDTVAAQFAALYDSLVGSGFTRPA
jgi:glycosyltransferase involved in cell wall biosynthesis